MTPQDRIPAHPALRSILIAFASGIVALACALAVYRLVHAPQHYPQLVVGSLAWNAGSKEGELPAALAFLIVLPLAWWILRKADDIDGDQTSAGFLALLIACLPGIAWLAQALVVPWAGMTWLYVCAGFVCWWAIGAHAMHWRNCTLPGDTQNSPADYAIAFGLTPVLAGFSALGVFYLVNRTLLVVAHAPVFPIGFGIAALALMAVLFRSRNGRSPATDWRRIVLLSQAGIPLLAFGMIPTPILLGHELRRVQPLSLALATFSALLALAVLADILRPGRRRDTAGISSLASPLALFLCLWILRSPFTDIPIVSIDDWHFGELLLPWNSWRDFGLVPYADVIPVRGFISLLDAALAQLVMTGSAADLVHLRPMLALLYSGVVFLSMRYAAGTLAALVAVAVLDFASPITRIDYLYVAGICVQIGLASRGRWSSALFFWLVSSILFSILAPGQGVLYAVASLPLLCHAVFSASGRQRAALIGAAALACVGVGALVLFNPTIGQVWTGVRLYFADNVAINTVGSGIPWSESFEPRPGQSALVREVFRSFFLVVAAGVAWVGFAAWRQPAGASSGSRLRDGLVRLDRHEIAVAASILFTVLVFLPRVLGRIDVDAASRLGALTLLVCSLVPLVAARRFHAATRGAIAVGLVFVAAATRVTPDASNEGATPFATNVVQIPRQFNVADGLMDETASGMHGVGTARFDPTHLAHLRHVRRLIDEMLPARTPYYDFTNHNAHYVYFDRPVATRWSSPYYLADERAQVRTAGEIETKRIPLLLLSADNIEHDGGSAALRAYWLYRFTLTDYVPFDRDGYVFAVRRDLVAQPGFAAFVQGSAVDLALFERAFAVTDLKSIPIAWGASAATLERSFLSVRLDAPIADVGSGQTGLGPAPARADGVGMVWFDTLRLTLQCSEGGRTMHLRWSAQRHGKTSSHELAFTAESGVLLVPVGMRPAWMLADEIADVTLESDGSTCSARSAQWLQRRPPETDPPTSGRRRP